MDLVLSQKIELQALAIWGYIFYMLGMALALQWRVRHKTIKIQKGPYEKVSDVFARVKRNFKS